MKIVIFHRIFAVTSVITLIASCILLIFPKHTPKDYVNLRFNENDISNTVKNVTEKLYHWENAPVKYTNHVKTYELFNTLHNINESSLVATESDVHNTIGIELISIKPILYRIQLKGWVEDKRTVLVMLTDIHSEQTFIGSRGICFPEKKIKILSIDIISENWNGITRKIPQVVIFDELINEAVTLKANSDTYRDWVFSFCESRNKNTCFNLSTSKKIYKSQNYNITLLGFDLYKETAMIEKHTYQDKKTIQTLTVSKPSVREICVTSN